MKAHRYAAPVLVGVGLGMITQSTVFASNSPVSEEVVYLAEQCAPNVDPLTMAYIVAHESGNRQFAINVNHGGPQLPRQPLSREEALSAIERLEAEGHNYDLGYAQINSANFEWLGVTAEDMLDPCRNLSASEHVISDCYGRAKSLTNESQDALRKALSCYNTGSFERGFSNGYVNRVESVAAQDSRVPRLVVAGEGQPSQPAIAPVREVPSAEQDTGHNPGAFGAPMADAFGRDASSAFAASPADSRRSKP